MKRNCETGCEWRLAKTKWKLKTKSFQQVYFLLKAYILHRALHYCPFSCMNAAKLSTIDAVITFLLYFSVFFNESLFHSFVSHLIHLNVTFFLFWRKNIFFPFLSLLTCGGNIVVPLIIVVSLWYLLLFISLQVNLSRFFNGFADCQPLIESWTICFYWIYTFCNYFGLVRATKKERKI